jgi:hypothetical protein
MSLQPGTPEDPDAPPHAVGRPPLWTSPEGFQAKVDEYIAQQEATGEPLTMSGLAFHLGFESRQSMWAYGRKDGFGYVVNRARLAIENQREASLAKGKTIPAGNIFILKNMGWSDKVAVTGDEDEHRGPVRLEVTRRIVPATQAPAASGSGKP